MSNTKAAQEWQLLQKTSISEVIRRFRSLIIRALASPIKASWLWLVRWWRVFFCTRRGQRPDTLREETSVVEINTDSHGAFTGGLTHTHAYMLIDTLEGACQTRVSCPIRALSRVNTGLSRIPGVLSMTHTHCTSTHTHRKTNFSFHFVLWGEKPRAFPF